MRSRYSAGSQQMRDVSQYDVQPPDLTTKLVDILDLNKIEPFLCRRRIVAATKWSDTRLESFFYTSLFCLKRLFVCTLQNCYNITEFPSRYIIGAPWLDVRRTWRKLWEGPHSTVNGIPVSCQETRDVSVCALSSAVGGWFGIGTGIIYITFFILYSEMNSACNCLPVKCKNSQSCNWRSHIM